MDEAEATRFLRERGYTVIAPEFTREESEAVARQYQAGDFIWQIVARTGRSKGQVVKALLRAGVEVRSGPGSMKGRKLKRAPTSRDLRALQEPT